jgi:hypothetical protein
VSSHEFAYTALDSGLHALVVPVSLPNGLIVNAKVDTGAELCSIPANMIHGLTHEEAIKIDRREYATAAGRVYMDTYAMTLTVCGYDFRLLVAANAGSKSYIGLNLLNQLVSTLDGPRLSAVLTLHP